MQRLLLLKLDAVYCAAEAWLNGVPLLRLGAGGGSAVLAVHEYLCQGANELRLLVEPGARALRVMPREAAQLPFAECRLLLPRPGHAADETRVRTLGELAWQPQPGQRVELPLNLSTRVELPVSFPRWRWLDAPQAEVKPALEQRAHELLGSWRDDLERGQTEAFVQACRLRTEELAAAYQLDAAQQALLLGEHLRNCGEQPGAHWSLPEAQDFHLRAVADSRLFECVDADGAPALRCETAPGEGWSFALRLAVVEGRLYVLR